MSQQLPDDFPIDPTTTSGDELAEILNRMNAAMQSTNSGATAPSSTYPGMQWLDTSVTPSVLRIRNAGNTGWLTVSTMGQGPFGLADGTVAAPGLAFISEPGLGLMRQGASI